MLEIYRLNRIFFRVLFACLIVNIALWGITRHMRPMWGNVPPALSERGAMMTASGDGQLAYRMIGLMLQNLGNTGGDSRALKEYNYKALGDWFRLADKMDPQANYVPYLAAYYFGASQNPQQLDPVIDYLHDIGLRPVKNNWRWLAQAVYLARYRQGDLNKAMNLANELAALDHPDMPIWARTMPAFVMRAQGDKEAAYNILMGTLASGAETLDPYEIRFIRDNVCDQILTPAQAARIELCSKTP